MSIERAMLFAVWLVLALLCGALIVFVWERWRAKRAARNEAKAQPVPPDNVGGVRAP